MKDTTTAQHLSTDHRQRLELLGLLAMELVHDLANPLNFIKGSATALQMSLHDLQEGKASAAEQQHLLAESQELSAAIEVGARQAGKLIDTIRQLGKPARFVTEVVLQKVVDDCALLLRYRLNHGIQLRNRVAANLTVLAKEVHVHQMIINLVVNAVQAIEAKPGRSRHEQIVVSALAGNGFVRLSVQDSGGGMSEATVQQLFKPSELSSATGDGLGLGLGIVHKLATDYGGKIEVVSHLGSGTTCTLSLPLA